MNSKASRSQIQFPLLLNMSDDLPTVHPDFQSAERINAPFVNGMMTPHYEQVVPIQDEVTFDKYNNKYSIHDDFLYKNDEPLFEVTDQRFVQTDITDTHTQYVAFDYDNSGNIAYIKANTNNTFTCQYRGYGFTTDVLYTTGRFVTARIRILANRPIAVITYVTDDNKLQAILWDGGRAFTTPIVWYTQQPRQNYTDAQRFVNRNTDDISGINTSNIEPLIQISNPITNTIAVSLASNYGEQLNTLQEGYWTVIWNYATGQFYNMPTPRDQTETGSFTTTQYDTFLLSRSMDSNYTVVQMYNKQGIWYSYPDNEVLPNQNHIRPTQVGQIITIDNQDYQLCSQYLYTTTYTFTCVKHQVSPNTYTFHINGSDASFSGDTATITISATDWNNNTTFPSAVASVSTNGQSYPFSNNQVSVPYDVTTTQGTIGWVVGPNFFLDDGTIRAWYQCPSWNETTDGSWSPANQILAIGGGVQNIIVDSATMTDMDYTTGKYGFTSKEWHVIDANSVIPRSNCIAVGQNFWSDTVLLSSRDCVTPGLLYGNVKDTSLPTVDTFTKDKKVVSFSNSNATDMRYYSGLFLNTDYKFYSGANGNAPIDVAWFNVGGFRVPKGHWNILYYSSPDSVADIQGLSYSETPDTMGTIVAPWNTIDSSFYITANDNFLIYRDTNKKIYRVDIRPGATLSSLFDNTVIIVNTTSYWNCYDAVNNKIYHYATDYNNRIKFGIPRQQYSSTLAATVYMKGPDSKLAISAINASYNNTKEIVSSIQAPILSLSWLYNDKRFVQAYQSIVPALGLDVQPIDVYYQGTDEGANISVGGTSVTVAKYKYSIYPEAIQVKIRRNMLVNSLYDGVSTNYNPDIFAQVINGAGNNDFITEHDSSYPLLYNNFSQPIFLFSAVGAAYNVAAFFVLQGQYYAVMNDKLYTLTYYNGMIQNQDAVVDIRGLKFIGNTPEIAFFWNEKKRAFYSYTGDGILAQIFDATKYSLENFSFKHFYDETTMSIWIPTSIGLLCFGVKNTYLMEGITDVKSMVFTEDLTYIIQDGQYTVLSYFMKDGFTPIPIDLETSFYGLGNNEVSTIDRWNITLFDRDHTQCEITVGVRSLTDITVKSEEKTYKISAQDYDKWSHSILLSYTPALIKGQGIRLYIKSPVAIQKIVPHVADQGYSVTTKREL